MSDNKETNHFCIRCIKYKTCIKAYKTIAADCIDFDDGQPPYVCPPLIHANQAGWEIKRDNDRIKEIDKAIEDRKNLQINNQEIIKNIYHCNDCEMKYPCVLKIPEEYTYNIKPHICVYQEKKANWIKIDEKKYVD